MSVGYLLVKLVLKLKGEKRSWQQDPTDYIKKRKQDIHKPSSWLLKGNSFITKEIGGSLVTKITPKNRSTSTHVLLYCHGGAFVYGPTRENWVAVSKIVKHARINVWMIDYPKAPENTIEAITKSVYAVYNEAIKTYTPANTILMGDSAGGNLIVTLAQRLSQEKKLLPNRLIVITPIVDASVSNPKIKEVDLIDPILSHRGVLSTNKMCAGQMSLTDPLISPLYGNVENMPPIHLFMATNDILTPDQELFAEKLKHVHNDLEVIIGEDMPHVWPILPIMSEAKKGMQKIISIIKSVTNYE
ncbi:alpha/beta hydrolase [Aquimarina pacifica]|uniref:alpha/beta hydrolase n=1 Tax=Aquimarina pacifica TaxID=1296415 RepID=UPI00046EA1EC|nr:alpha/beta hydrolase [Aquimarina pacifica]